MEFNKQQTEEEIQGYINSFSFCNFEGFDWQYNLTGMADFKFGSCAHNNNITNVVHELAHAVDFGFLNFKKRVSSCGTFVFNEPKELVLGRQVCEPVTSRMTERETRVVAISVLLLESIDYFSKSKKDQYVEELIEALDFLPDSHYTSYDQRSLMVDKFLKSLSINDIHIELKNWFLCVKRTKKLRSGRSKLTETVLV